MGVAWGWLWCGFEVALGWLWVPNRLPTACLPNGFRVALWWLCTPESMPSICLLYGFVVALGGSARPSGLAFASGVREMSERAKLPDSSPLARQGESGPKERVLEFVGTEQRQLRFPPGYRAGLAGAPAPGEFRRQPAGGFVAHFPMARQHGLSAGDAEGPAAIGKNERIGCDETIKPPPRTAALPARGPSLRPPPASRGGSRICSGCASPCL